jgi:hypothetical protein
MGTTITLQFTHAELAALIEVAKQADMAGIKINGPAAWAMNRITNAWKDTAQEKASK